MHIIFHAQIEKKENEYINVQLKNWPKVWKRLEIN